MMNRRGDTATKIDERRREPKRAHGIYNKLTVEAEQSHALIKPESRKFFPYALFEIAVASLFAIELVLVLAVLFPPAVGREIDFSAQYQPRPEWYFLFLYQLTKYFPGRWTFVGAVLLPGLTFSLVLLAPFLDSGPETDWRRRKTASSIGFCLLAAVVLLTVLSLL